MSDDPTPIAAAPAAAAVEARLALPAIPDAAGLAVLAAADGNTIVDHGLEPPLFDHGVVDTLPHAVPLLEWQQRRIPHLVVTADERGADVVTFGMDHYTRLDTYDDLGPVLIDRIARHADAIRAGLVVVSGSAELLPPIADALAVAVPVSCQVVIETEATDAEQLAAAVVRHVSDAAARITVGHLRDRRFLATHDAAVDGTDETIQALVSGGADAAVITARAEGLLAE